MYIGSKSRFRFLPTRKRCRWTEGSTSHSRRTSLKQAYWVLDRLFVLELGSAVTIYAFQTALLSYKFSTGDGTSKLSCSFVVNYLNLVLMYPPPILPWLPSTDPLRHGVSTSPSSSLQYLGRVAPTEPQLRDPHNLAHVRQPVVASCLLTRRKT